MGDHPENLPLYNPGWENNFPSGWKYVRGSDGAIDGEVDRNKDSPLYSHTLPLVVYLDITCPPEFSQIRFLVGYIIDFIQQTMVSLFDSYI